MTRVSHGLIVAYHDTIYRVHGLAVHDKRIGQRSLETETLMRDYRVRTAAVLTAENPGSRRQARLVNRIRSHRLDMDLKALALSWLPTSAIDVDGIWPQEAGRLVFGPTFSEIAGLSRRFDQNAFLWVEFGRPTALVLCR